MAKRSKAKHKEPLPPLPQTPYGLPVAIGLVIVQLDVHPDDDAEDTHFVWIVPPDGGTPVGGVLHDCSRNHDITYFAVAARRVGLHEVCVGMFVVDVSDDVSQDAAPFVTMVDGERVAAILDDCVQAKPLAARIAAVVELARRNRATSVQVAAPESVQ